MYKNDNNKNIILEKEHSVRKLLLYNIYFSQLLKWTKPIEKTAFVTVFPTNSKIHLSKIS